MNYVVFLLGLLFCKNDHWCLKMGLLIQKCIQQSNNNINPEHNFAVKFISIASIVKCEFNPIVKIIETILNISFLCLSQVSKCFLDFREDFCCADLFISFMINFNILAKLDRCDECGIGYRGPISSFKKLL